MIKQLILLIHFLGLFLYQLIFTTDVTVKQELPSNMTPGSSVTVSIIINKNDITGFAKVQQELPDGFAAEVLDSKGATFSFKDQKLKMIWMSLPPEEEFTISYKLIAKTTTIGEFTLAGKFSYIADSERKNINISPATISVSQEIVADSEVSETADEEETVIEPSETESIDLNDEAIAETIQPITINANRTIDLLPSDKHKVTLTIDKVNLEGFTKITETIPVGFIAVSDQNQGGVFSFKDQEAKILWLTVPNDEKLTVSYIIEPVTAINGDFSVNGVISYLENDETNTYNIDETTFVLAMENEVVAEEIVEEAVNKQDEISLSDKIQDAMGNKEEVKEEIVDQVEEIMKETTPVLVDEKENDKEVVNPIKDITSVTNPEVGVSYKIQVAALRKQVKTSYISKRFKISRPVSIESHEGWSKYILGSHTVYREAKEERDYIRKKVEKAFVTAYNQGERITVQEALMITNQKWYK